MMECLLCLILQLLSLRKAAAQTYTHTTYARQLNTITPSQPTLLGTIETKTVSECGQICHYSSTCSSFLFNGTHCVTFEGTMYFDEGGQREEYFILSNRLVHSDISGTFAAECTSHGYLYDPLVPLCYKVNDTGLAKADAMASCEQSNGHLLRINTYRKQLLVESLNLQATETVLMGFTH
ncbi:uncharacterized protein LOC134241653 isoform X3 [Saccostrea cucullata]|uniref:uncharacterized protein LOC134241653 isoform X3 n=1 Tax=Saccostrea cuccullata TaxID=36930 RepID=UPI002ED2D6A2